jgi:hypothetical protein
LKNEPDVSGAALVVLHVNISARAAVLCLLVSIPVASLAQGSGVTVEIAGAPVTFDQPPVEQAGRVYVPLRGVFERLGATVVYANGVINATSGSHEISLKIGQTSATVDGVQQNLDSPPFLIAGRTLVPLRFISQALGATVNFDQQAQTVYVTPPQATVPPPHRVAAVPPPPAAPIAMRLLRLEPANEAAVNSQRPELAATFGEPVDPNSVHVLLDDRDVTPQTYVSSRSIVYDPGSDLPDGPHTVVVLGRTPDHEPFRERWTFATSGIQTNYISGLEPPNGTPARRGFTVSGYTHPGSHIKIISTTSEVIPNFSEVAEGSIATEGQADPSGYFAIRVELPGPAESLVDVRIASTAPDGGVAVRTLRLQR